MVMARHREDSMYRELKHDILAAGTFGGAVLGHLSVVEKLLTPLDVQRQDDREMCEVNPK